MGEEIREDGLWGTCPCGEARVLVVTQDWREYPSQRVLCRSHPNRDAEAKVGWLLKQRDERRRKRRVA